MDDPLATELPDVLPDRHADVLWTDFDTETVVFVPGQRVAHHLDEGLSVVFDSCDGPTASEALVTEVVESTGQQPDAVRRWLRGSLEELRRLGVFDPPPAS